MVGCHRGVNYTTRRFTGDETGNGVEVKRGAREAETVTTP